MAVTHFWAPLLILFLAFISMQKWHSIVEYQYLERYPSKEFMFCTPLAPKRVLACGCEALYRIIYRANSVNVSRLCSANVSSLFILLLLGGDIELNPGDKWPSCGVCSNQVKPSQEGMKCDQCNSWFHMNCRLMSNEMCNILISSSCVWLCLQCNNLNQSSPSLCGSLDSLCSKNYFEPLNEEICESSLPTQSHVQNCHNKKRNQPKRNRMSCLLINCRSIKNKVADVAAVISEHDPDIILGTESWLNPEIGSGEIFPETYNVFRKDRITNSHEGGVFQAIKKDIIVTHRTDLDTECEIIWTQCQLAGRKSKSILFGSYYRPNVSDMDGLVELNVSLLKMRDNINKSNVLLAGDFNAPDIDWQNPETSSTCKTSERLLEIIDEHDLTQLVQEPTRRQGEIQNILDLVLSNNKNLGRNVTIIPGISDHDMVLFTVRPSCKKKRNVKRKIYCSKRANCIRIKEELKALSNDLIQNTKHEMVDRKWDKFEYSVRRIMDTHIPHKMTTSRHNLPWFNRTLRREGRAKQRLYNKAKKSGNPTHWHQFRAARKRLHQNLKTARDIYVSEYLGDAIEENPKRFWSYVKQLKQDNLGVADLEIDGKLISDGQTKSEILNKQFSSVFTDENLANIPAVGDNPKPAIRPIILPSLVSLSSYCR